MSIEDRLESELGTIADQLSPPIVSTSGLERAGRREQARRRTTAVVVGAAASLLLVVAVAAVPRMQQDSDPAPPVATHTHPTKAERLTLPGLPEGPATDVPWWQDGVLHVGGTTIPTSFRSIVYRGGTTVVGRSSTAGAEWYLIVGDTLEPLISSAYPSVPVVSADGARIAWVEETGRRQLDRTNTDVDYRVVAYDAATRQAVGSLERTERVQCCDAGGVLTVAGIDLDGRVVLIGGESLAWTPGHDPVRLRGPGADGILGDIWPGGVMWQGQGEGFFDLVGEYGTVGADGVIHRVGAVPNDQFGIWSPDGTAYVYPGDAGGGSPAKVTLDHLWISSPENGQPVELRLPPTPTYEILTWESANAVIIQARQPYGEPGDFPAGLVQLVRCSSRSGVCERVSDGPTRRAVFPDA
jgi:hypothetical protein